MSKPSLFPTLSAWQLGRSIPAFMTALEGIERFRLFASIVLPTLSRFAFLGGFAVTMKGFVAVGSETPDPAAVWVYGSAMLALLLVAAVFQFAQLRTHAHLQSDLNRAVRRIIGREMRKIGLETTSGARSKRNLEVEKLLSQGAAPGILAVVELLSGLLFVVLALVAITITLPIAGVIMAGVGLLLLLVFRLKVKGGKVTAEGDRKVQAAERNGLVRSLLMGTADEDAARDYEHNAADLSQESKVLQQRNNENRMGVISSIIAAMLLAICFVLVAFTGLRGHDPIHLIFFVIAVRLFVQQGRRILRDWTAILRSKKTLFAFSMILTGRDGFGNLRERSAAQPTVS